ncbi:MAG: CDGSH iron-sulfur domain-containing protein, partial [Butyricimonas paravirosa]
REIEPGTPEINKKYSIVVDRKGPYLVYGHPLLKQQFIVQNVEGSSWSYRDGVEYDMNDNPTALCRCGTSANKPYCDGAHLNTNWDPTLTADNIPLLKDADVVDGPTLELTDNEKYCAFTVCDAYGKVWSLVESPMIRLELIRRLIIARRVV